MRTVPSGLKPEFYRLFSKPLQIFELYLEEPYTNPSHFYVANNENITFNSQVYTALAIKRGAFRSEEGTVLNELELGLDNTDLEFKNLVASGAFNKKRVVVKLVFANALSNPANYVTLLDGDLDEPKGDNRWITMTVRPFAVLEREFPRRIFQVGCNYTFGDESCGLTRSDFDDTKTITTATAAVLQFVDDGHVANYWRPGYLEFTSGDLVGITRPVSISSSDRITLRVPFPSAPAPGDTFFIQKLCAKTPDACKDIFNNYLNYGGYPHVPKKPVV